ncbi:STAS domain-containing protein [Kitasatospora sp. NPDC094028]
MARPAEDPGATEGGRDRGALTVAVSREGPVRVVAVAGELDHDTADGLRAALGRPVDDGLKRIVVDLADLRFCDSTGLNILLRSRIEAEAAGLRLEVAGLRPVVARLFEITGVESVLRVHPDLESALKASGSDPGESGSPVGPGAE